ncbi:MAG TPA: Gfo/Idh/MocA family oxidoreductase [Polyangiaceae bacterium]|nr:Gfo/Idh/MocA family oxidoreductase [Polyangiaceae bacterium]
MTKQQKDLSRRDFALASAGVGALVASAETACAGPRRKRYAIVGVGSRSYLYQEALHTTFAESSELVAVCDSNAGRAELASDYAKQNKRKPPKLYAAADFDRMLREQKPETVIVTTIDATHDDYICRVLKHGADVITEKPMTTEAEKCQRILDARKQSGKRCTVAFNYRYAPVRSQVKQLLMSGVIGDVLSVDFHWMLDTHHGADYFRRWHSQKRFSGGLMVHKATHHFDLVNWWLSAVPVRVQAIGKREFYTPGMARRLGLKSHHERCHGCPEAAQCGFELDLGKDPRLKSLYLDQEKHDGYFRDRCVFRPDIDIEDTMNVQVAYDTGATLSYSLNAFNAWEGYVVVFNGSQGRLEHKMEEAVVLDPARPGGFSGDGTTVRIYPSRKPAYRVEPAAAGGDHAGADPVMLEDLLSPNPKPDKLLRRADERSGAYSILIGVAANRSFVTQQSVEIASLVRDLGMPDYPPMPTRGSNVAMPPKV